MLKTQLDKTINICVWPQDDPALSRNLDWRPPVVPSNLTYPVIIKSQRREENKESDLKSGFILL